jgi:hypothetical protein
VLLALTGGFGLSDYDNSNLGLKDDLRWNVGFDADYSPIERLTLSGWYSYDVIRTKLRSINRANTAQTPATDPDLVCKSKTNDFAHTFGIDAFAIVVPNLLDWRVSSTIQLARANTTDKGGSLSGADIADLGDIDDDLYSVSTELTWHVLEPLDLIGGYRYENLNTHNYRYEFGDPGTNTGDINLYMRNGPRNYDAHIVMLTARYEF